MLCQSGGSWYSFYGKTRPRLAMYLTRTDKVSSFRCISLTSPEKQLRNIVTGGTFGWSIQEKSVNTKVGLYLTRLSWISFRCVL